MMDVKVLAVAVAAVVVAVLAVACAGSSTDSGGSEGEVKSMAAKDNASGYDTGIIPDELEYIPDGYRSPAVQAGTLEKLTYSTYDSFNYGQPGHELTKDTWVYVPYGYDPSERYDVFYLSHGGWSDETTLMGTDSNPTGFKNVVDHAIEDGIVRPLIMVMPTYNNLSRDDAGDFFIFSATGTNDFAYSGFKAQIEALAAAPGGTFAMADSLDAGSVSYREREGYEHNYLSADEYTFNALRFFFNGTYDREGEEAAEPATERVSAETASFEPYTIATLVDEVRNDSAFGASSGSCRRSANASSSSEASWPTRRSRRLWKARRSHVPRAPTTSWPSAAGPSWTARK